jgi:hypothetical protein
MQNAECRMQNAECRMHTPGPWYFKRKSEGGALSGKKDFSLLQILKCPKKFLSKYFVEKKIRNSLFLRGAQMPQNRKKTLLFSG